MADSGQVRAMFDEVERGIGEVDDEASFVTGQWLSPNGGLLTI